MVKIKFKVERYRNSNRLVYEGSHVRVPVHVGSRHQQEIDRLAPGTTVIGRCKHGPAGYMLMELFDKPEEVDPGDTIQRRLDLELYDQGLDGLDLESAQRDAKLLCRRIEALAASGDDDDIVSDFRTVLTLEPPSQGLIQVYNCLPVSVRQEVEREFTEWVLSNYQEVRRLGVLVVLIEGDLNLSNWPFDLLMLEMNRLLDINPLADDFPDTLVFLSMAKRIIETGGDHPKLPAMKKEIEKKLAVIGFADEFDCLRNVTPGIPRDEAGNALTAAEFIDRVFGRSMMQKEISNADRNRPRWFDTEMIVKVDSAWLTERQVREVVSYLKRNSIRTCLKHIDTSSGPDSGYRLLLEMELNCPPGPQLPKLKCLGSSKDGFPGEGPDIRSCEHCGTAHRVYERRKPQPTSEQKDLFYVLCLSCGRGEILLSAWEGCFRIEVVSNPDFDGREPSGAADHHERVFYDREDKGTGYK